MEIIRRDGLARIGRFTTLHGKVETPTILPVVNPNLLVITPKEMKKFGAQAIITMQQGYAWPGARSSPVSPVCSPPWGNIFQKVGSSKENP